MQAPSTLKDQLPDIFHQTISTTDLLPIKKPHHKMEGPKSGFTDYCGTTFAALGPFGPASVSKLTCWPSDKDLKPET